ncbi:HPr family phosphocarrier protein [Zavarzinella formosa]|uniref:HPr family phosphocarrier protein n=1 Tax=Zavarzinella formosa TaxID=360055 RepID=UPI0019309BD1|nr:HPr family phosphocarrier protein [Zavarzinella formosa]
MKTPESATVDNVQPISESKAIRVPVVLRNPLGLHMRPAAAFAKTAGRFQSAIMVFKGQRAANGKSFTNLLMLAAGPGTELIVEADGPDASEACRVLAEILGSTSPDGHESHGH